MRRALPLFVACTAALGCEPVETPGTSLGLFDVDGTLTENTCGDNGLPAERSLKFQVEVRRLTEATGSWILDTPPGTNGTLGADGRFVFVRSSDYVAIEPSVTPARADEPSDYWSGQALQTPVATRGCILEVEEQVRGTVVGEVQSSQDAGTEASELTALNVIRVTPSPGSNCEQALAIVGGPFTALPCSATYELQGTNSDSP